jgi:division protein CdvB (Snf7/Vps24/ESCRT-III family)
MGGVSEGPTTADLVAERFTNSQDYAMQASQSALDFVAQLRGLAGGSAPGVDDISVGVEVISIEPNFPLPPEPLEVTMEAFTSPPEPVIEDVTVGAIEPPPSFDVTPVVIDLPVKPEVPTVPTIEDAPILAEIPIPNAPVITAVTVPTLRDLTIPAAPEFETIAFEGVMPIDDLVIPTTPFSFSEIPYASDLLTNTKEKLNDLVVNGGTGFDAEWEEIWNRETERAELALAERKDALSAEWAERGFDLPNGVLTSLLLALDTEYINQRFTTSRDTAIKQIEVAKEETQFALKQGSDLEAILMNYASQVAQRQLEAAKAVVDYAINIYNAYVARYNARMEGYKAQASIYETRIRGMLARVEVFKAQIDAQRLIGEMNTVDVELYGKMLQASQVMIEIYKTEMEASQVRAGIEKLRIDAYKAKVDSYTAVVQLHVSLYNMYEAGIRGELAKAQIYSTQVDAYKSRVDAARTNADIVIETAKVEGEMEKLKLALYTSRLEAYKTQIQAEVSRVTGLIDIYKGEVEAFKAQTEGEAAKIDAIVKEFTAKVSQNVEVARVSVEVAKTSLEAWTSLNTLRGDLLKAGATVLAQIAASALSGVNASAQIGASISESIDHRDSVSSSIDTNYNNNYNY